MTNVSIVEQVLGIDQPEDRLRSLGQAMLTLTGQAYPELPMARTEDRTLVERAWDFTTVDGLLAGNASQASTLTDWQTYCRLLRDHGHPDHDGHGKALLIGAFTAISSRSFECLARTEYGADDIQVIDPVAGDDKRRHGNFVEGNGLDMPFPRGSMDFIHTNRLIHMLRDPADPTRSKRQNRSRLFGEIARVAAPGAQVLMVETVPGQKEGEGGEQMAMRAMKFADLIGMALYRAGFGYVYASVGHVPRGAVTRADRIKLLFDPQRPLETEPRRINTDVVEVYARKPVTETFALGRSK